MSPLPGPARRSVLVASALAGLTGLCLLAAPCGGAGTSRAARPAFADSAGSGNGSIAPGKFAASLAYSRCMRSHGVPDFPDPRQVAGGGIQIAGSVPGIDPQSPLFLSARQSCEQLLPGGQPTGARQLEELTRMLHVSQCMRAHRITAFPDPTVSAPSSRAGYSAVMSNGFVWLAIPDSIGVRSPAFRRAAAACKLGLS